MLCTWSRVLLLLRSISTFSLAIWISYVRDDDHEGRRPLTKLTTYSAKESTRPRTASRSRRRWARVFDFFEIRADVYTTPTAEPLTVTKLLQIIDARSLIPSPDRSLCQA